MRQYHPHSTYQRADTNDGTEYQGFEIYTLDSKLTYTSQQHIVDETSRRSTGLSSRLLPTSITSRLAGWRLGSYFSALTATISLVINIVALIALNHHQDADTKLVRLFTGSCHRVTAMTIWIHLAINALSTVLLAGSNYCMQCLCAPTRKDVDKAHCQGRYLDIGVPSVRNLRSIGRFKLVLWWILGLSSIPLHLM